MNGPKFAEAEERVLFFERRPLAAGVFAAHIKLGPGQSSTFHWHTQTRDTFYVLAGTLTVLVRVTPGAWPYYMHAGSHFETREMPQGLMHHLALTAGSVCIVEPKAVHCTANPGPDVCEFLCIEGFGTYDFNPVG